LENEWEPLDCTAATCPSTRQSSQGHPLVGRAFVDAQVMLDEITATLIRLRDAVNDEP
jgi:hypothetical protein